MNPLRSLLGRWRAPACSTAQSHVARGKELSAEGHHAQAAAAFRDAIASDADCAEAHYGLGLALRDQQQLGAALNSYRRATELAPDHIEAHNNMGALLQLQGDLNGALTSYRRAVSLKPPFTQPYLNLGRLCESIGQLQDASDCYRAAISAGVDTDTFGHLLNAATGVTTGRAPAAYARTVFDNFAADFDRRLVDDLGYRIPQILAERVKALIPDVKLRVLDLGCGTGLCGVQLQGRCERLTGVDVSPAMLARASAHGIYDDVCEMDVTDYLRTAPSSHYNVVLAADVFVYIGDLARVFMDVSRVLKAGGVFGFSVEQAAGERDFVLQPVGRFAQSVAYIRRLCSANGLVESESFAQTIRGDPATTAPGCVFLLSKL